MSYTFEVWGDRGMGTQEKLFESDILDEALERFNSEESKFMHNGWTTLDLIYFDESRDKHSIKKGDIEDYLAPII